jgi:membrane metallo-endopeptidase-like protein 1
LKKENFLKVYQGTKVQAKRSLVCSNFVNGRMEQAVGTLYVSKYFDKNAKQEALNMVNNLLQEFKQILRESDWMDDESKKVAIEKVFIYLM